MRGLSAGLAKLLLRLGDVRPSRGRDTTASVPPNSGVKVVRPYSRVESGGTGTSRGADGAAYRVDHEAADRFWDPYAPDQSRSSRARAARQRANARPVSSRAVPDYYLLLGVPATASTIEIERAYRRHAAIIHPDRYFDQPSVRLEAEAKLRQLNEAASVLRDPERRLKYDAEWQLREGRR